MFFKYVGILGLLLLVLSRILLIQGDEFIQAQSPFDFAHLSMLIGAVLTIAFCFVFPKNLFNSIATPMIILGAVAHIGMCTLDFTLWSYGDDADKRNELVRHLMETPKLWVPYFIIGPALLYAGLTTQAWYFIRRQTIPAIIALTGGLAIGLGQMIWHNQSLTLAGYIAMSLGLSMLALRSE